jgi:hypothetical protein
VRHESIGQPLTPLAGRQFFPAWLHRLGSYKALAHLSPTSLYLWGTIHSFNLDFWKPCYTSWDQLAATLKVNRKTIRPHLEALSRTGLLFELDRGTEPKSRRKRAVARWALDPFYADQWRPKVDEVLARIAEDDGHDGRWYHNAVQALDAFERRSRILRAKIADDMLVDPRPPRKRKKSRARSKKRTEVQKPDPRGVFYHGGGSKAKAKGEADPSVRRNGKRDGDDGGVRRTQHTGVDSSVRHTHDPPEAQAAQGLSASRGQKTDPAEKRFHNGGNRGRRAGRERLEKP